MRQIFQTIGGIRMTKARKRILIAVLLSLVTFLATFSALRLYTHGQQPVVVSVQPPSPSYQVDSFFDIYLVIEDWPPESLDAFELWVDYNSALMEVTNVAPGPVVPAGDFSRFGWGHMGMSSIYIYDMPWNGILLNMQTGPVAIITFHCLSAGISPVTIQTSSVFYDMFGGQYPVMPINGQVEQTPPPAHTYLDPTAVTVPYSSPFTESVNVQNVINLYAFSLAITYNTQNIDAVDIVPGSFLPQPVIDSKTIDDTAGTINFAVHSGTQGGTSGSGTLATITFHCTGVGTSSVTITGASLMDPSGLPITTTIGGSSTITQYSHWEPTDLEDIVNLPYTYALQDRPFIPPGSPVGYAALRSMFESKGYMFDVDGGSSWWVQSFFDVHFDPGSDPFDGIITSWWSTNILADGTKACLLSAEMSDGTNMTMGFITNVLPPEQMPGVDPYIIWNAEPYFFVEFYWWSWHPINRIITWSYWWHDSHNHPNWFWGVYSWWRTYTKAYYLGYWPPVDVNWVYWQPWWGWWWHWIYWQHWHWWSTYFPYDVV